MSSPARNRIWAGPSMATALYIAIAIVMTWPLASVMQRKVAGDLGDPLFNCWILLWTGGQMLRLLHGDLSSLSHYWNANIFYPAPLTLAYSEHLTPLTLQILPVLAATQNIILCYNLLVLGTFVLSGLGMFLLVRELTGRPLAAFLAGLAFAFAPYRLDQYAHLEVVSSQWMPFAFYGFRRFFTTDRWRPLAGGAAAMLAQGLSCGYYLAYFPPFAVAYCLYEMTTRGKIRDLTIWRRLAVAGAAVLFVTALFLRPYFHVRSGGEVGVRAPADIEQFSADTHAFATVSSSSRLWGGVFRAMPRNEGQGFPGVTIVLLAAAAAGAGVKRAREHARGIAADRPWQRTSAIVLAVLLASLLVVLFEILVTGVAPFSLPRVLPLSKNPATRLLGVIAVVAAALLGVSRKWRAAARGVPGSPLAFFVCAAVAAAWMSLGPMMHAAGHDIGPGLYDVFYRGIPGFDGLRVVSLNFMLVAFFLAVLAGLGAATLLARPAVAWRGVVVVTMVAILAECWSVPTAASVRMPAPGLAWPSENVADVPRVYALIRGLPDSTVVAEFPFGATAYEIRYVFFSGYHRRPIVNGYSGFSPSSYALAFHYLSGMPSSPEAWEALRASGATHAIVHERSFLDRDGIGVSDWLRRSGAREVAAVDGDRVFQLRDSP